jgi:probable HAF family extracellular repeat protein
MKKLLLVSFSAFVGAVLAVTLPQMPVHAGPPPARETRVPGDTNCDSKLDLSDAVFTLNYLFVGTAFPPCPLADRPELLAHVSQLETDLDACNAALTAMQSELATLQAELEATRTLLSEEQDALTATQALLDACLGKLPNPRYSVKGMGFLPGGIKNSAALAVNDGGQVVGYSVDGDKAFLWNAGVLTELGRLAGALSSQPADINSAGTVVGNSSPGLPFLIEAGVMRALRAAPGSYASAINDRGQIVGIDSLAVLWEGDARIPLGTLRADGSGGSRAEGINNLGQIVGASPTLAGKTHAFFWQNDVMSDLGALAGGDSSIANDVNDEGQIVGSSAVPYPGFGADAARAVRWKSFTDLTEDLGSPPGKDVRYGAARAINSHGQVVGEIHLEGDSSIRRGFLWEESLGMQDLNDLVDPSSRWTVTVATDINNAGQIVGIGVNPDGFTEAFLLTPAQ